MKTSELTGMALNYVVAKAQGFDVYKDEMLNGHIMHGFWVSGYYPGDLNSWMQLEHFTPSTSWMNGGPIIEQEGITVAFCSGDLGESRNYWIATSEQHSWEFGYGPYHEQDDEKLIQIYKRGIHTGPTPLIAAMRCLVASRFGDNVEIPKELL